ncbi:MAG: Rpn family recombination-promoting nuclease/putative transposase [Thermoguttaceae bacterium]|nr:Rpn family recombination-promoting nuclease/putative transposase [Thermoguttaceae bacterium]
MTDNKEFQVELYKDLIFRAIFGDNSVKNVLKYLLNAVLEQAELPLISELELGNTFKTPTFYGGKSSIMDIHAIDGTGRHFDIEMQVQPEKYFGERLFYYGAGMYGSSLKQGKGYAKLPKIVCVAFVNFPLSDEKPDVWFDKWQMRSTLGTGLGTDKMTNIFIRLPRIANKELSPPDKFKGQLVNWVKILSSYSNLSNDEKLELIRSTKGFDELERRIKYFFRTEEGRKVFIAQRELDSWAEDIRESVYEEEHKARIEAERERDEERRLYRERQKKLFVSILKSKFGAEPNLPENWADGRSSDDLDALTVKISECATLQDALAALR